MNSEALNSLFLVDTSVWIDVVQPGRGSSTLRDRVDYLMGDGRLAVTGPVRVELLGGARSERVWSELIEVLDPQVQLPVRDAHWDRAAQMNVELRRSGVTVPVLDLLIAAVAISNGAVVLHRDRHFDVIAEHAPLEVESYVEPPA